MSIQINRDNAKTYNIDTQNNYYIANAGSAFVSAQDCKEEKLYESVKDSLYYEKDYISSIISVIVSKHSILIQGEQGSGKSILAFKIAEQMKERGLITSSYYLNPPSDWNTIKQWIQSIHFQGKMNHSENVHLWIIDNLHKIPDGVEAFPDSSVWGSDFCICCTRDLNQVLSGNDVYFEMSLDTEQVIRRKIDERLFYKCYNALRPGKIGRSESDLLYRYIGGNLAILRYLIRNGKLEFPLIDLKKEDFIDFHNIYNSYLRVGKENVVSKDNLPDILKMLFLSQIDFSIPFYMECTGWQETLKDIYFRNADYALEIEHASLAELLTVSICKEYNIEYHTFFTDCLHWALSKLIYDRVSEEHQRRQVNEFLQLLFGHKFVLSHNQILMEILSDDENLCNFLKENLALISCSTWNEILEIVKEDSQIKNVFCNFATSSEFVDGLMKNSDYNFEFIRDKLSQAELEAVETHLLSHASALLEYVVSHENEVCLLHLLRSLSDETAIRFLELLPASDFVKLLSENNNGLRAWSSYYYKAGEKIQNVLDTRISIDDYRNIFINGASINGFVHLLSVATDQLKEELCQLLSADLVDKLIRNTIDKSYSIGTLGLGLRELKKESHEALRSFERAVGAEGYEQLLSAQGSIPVLMKLMEYSSEEMRKELSERLESNPELVKTLLTRTIEEGKSIGTLGLGLRELKKESHEALRSFERAVGAEGYKRLLSAQGSIPILMSLIRHSSEEMREKLSERLESNSELVEPLLTRTIEEGKSIGTLGLGLRELKKESHEALRSFERAVGAEGYKRLLSAQGSIPILMSLIRHSSEEMREKLSERLEKPEVVKKLLDKTIEEGKSIGSLNRHLRALGKMEYSSLRILENLIGVNGYLSLFSACNTNSITILRIMACSCISDFLVDAICTNMDIWDESKNYISDNSCTILADFNSDLYYAKKMGRRKFFGFLQKVVSSEEWVDWMRRGATLEEVILIIINLPLNVARQICNILWDNYDEMIKDFHFVERQRKDKKAVDPQVVKRGIDRFKNYNFELSEAIKKEYTELSSQK